MTSEKTIALTIRTFVSKIMPLLFNMLSAAAAVKSLQSCLTRCDPIDGSLPGSSVHGIPQARVLEWGAIDQPRQHIKKQRQYFADKGSPSQSYSFSSSHVDVLCTIHVL